MGHPWLLVSRLVVSWMVPILMSGGLQAFVDAEAGDPDLAVAEHGSLVVDEEVFVFLILR